MSVTNQLSDLDCSISGALRRLQAARWEHYGPLNDDPHSALMPALLEVMTSLTNATSSCVALMQEIEKGRRGES